MQADDIHQEMAYLIDISFWNAPWWREVKQLWSVAQLLLMPSGLYELASILNLSSSLLAICFPPLPNWCQW